jgi:hypothetical protein
MTFLGASGAYQASLSNQLWLILAAVVCVYIVLGVLYESYIHPLTILSTLPSAGVGALLALMVTGRDLGVIGIIGIILLIGIVKKNAIMMIDFAIEAERDEGKDPRTAIHQAAMLRFRPILMTTLAALFAAVPLMLRLGRGRRAAPAAGPGHLRRPDRQPDADPVHHAGDLPGLRPPGAALGRPAGQAEPAKPGRSGRRCCRRSLPRTHSPGREVRTEPHEPVAALRPPPDRDRPADDRAGPGRHRRLLRAAGLAAAAGRLPGISVSASCRAPARTPWRLGRHAARAAAGDHRRRQRDHLEQRQRLDPHQPAVRPEPPDRLGRARSAGRDQRLARRPAVHPAQQSDLPQGQSRPTRR